MKDRLEKKVRWSQPSPWTVSLSLSLWCLISGGCAGPQSQALSGNEQVARSQLELTLPMEEYVGKTSKGRPCVTSKGKHLRLSWEGEKLAFSTVGNCDGNADVHWPEGLTLTLRTPKQSTPLAPGKDNVVGINSLFPSDAPPDLSAEEGQPIRVSPAAEILKSGTDRFLELAIDGQPVVPVLPVTNGYVQYLTVVPWAFGEYTVVSWEVLYGLRASDGTRERGILVLHRTSRRGRFVTQRYKARTTSPDEVREER